MTLVLNNMVILHLFVYGENSFIVELSMLSSLDFSLRKAGLNQGAKRVKETYKDFSGA